MNGTPMTILQPPSLKVDERMLAEHGTTILPRGRIERRVVWNLIAHLQRAGFYPVAVEADEDVATPTPEAMMEELFSMDEGWLWFRESPEHEARWVKVVLGNDGWDCVSDWGIPSQSDGFAEAMEAFDGEMFV